MFNNSWLKKLLYGSFFLTMTLATSSCRISDVGIPLNTTEVETDLVLEYGEVIIQDDVQEVIIPVGISVESYNRFSSSSKFHSQSDLYDANSLLATNLIFYNPKNNKTHLLLEQKAVISQFNYLQNPDLNREVTNKITRRIATAKNQSPPAQKIIYKIIDNDTDADGKLTRADAEIGYLSNLSGKELVQITPAQTKLLNWQLAPQTNMILISLQLDSNEDKKFTREDRIAGYIYSLSQNKLQLITPEDTSLLSWKIDPKNKLTWLKLRSDSNQDSQLNEKDETILMTINLENIAITNEILSYQIKEKIREINLQK